MDKDTASALGGGHGSDNFYGLGLRSSASACGTGEGGASCDAARDRSSKKKNDRIDASKIADCLRCDFLPECYMDSTEIRERRRTLRYRSLLVRQVVQLKTRAASLLMETGVSYDRQHLHRLGFIPELLARKDAI